MENYRCGKYHTDIKYAKTYNEYYNIFLSYIQNKNFYYYGTVLYVNEQKNEFTALLKFMIEKLKCVPIDYQINNYSFQENLNHPINMNTGIPSEYHESDKILKYEILQRPFIEININFEKFKKILEYNQSELSIVAKLPYFNDDILIFEDKNIIRFGKYYTRNININIKENEGDNEEQIDEIYLLKYGFHFKNGEIEYYDRHTAEIYSEDLNYYRDYSPGPQKKKAYEPIKYNQKIIDNEENRQKYWKNYELCIITIFYLEPSVEIEKFKSLLENICKNI